MTVQVHWTKDGEPRVTEFGNEQEASIFLTGLRNHDHRSYGVSFEKISYPEQGTDGTPADLRQ